MNVFMPCATIEESVRALDDKRLIKQILECEQILDANKRVLNGEQRVGYANHPVVKHYRDLGVEGAWFVSYYAMVCCWEYESRFGFSHSLEKDLTSVYIEWSRLALEKYNDGLLDYPPIIYAEGFANSPDCIRETDNEKVFELFKQKLIKKWDNDKYPPKWTNREKPSWYKGERK